MLRNTTAKAVIGVHAGNPRYWQYHGEPVLLVGGSETGHLFLADSLLEHLDEMAAIGANYVRNTVCACQAGLGPL